jgi:hypothetical protein
MVFWIPPLPSPSPPFGRGERGSNSTPFWGEGGANTDQFLTCDVAQAENAVGRFAVLKRLQNPAALLQAHLAQGGLLRNQGELGQGVLQHGIHLTTEAQGQTQAALLHLRTNGIAAHSGGGLCEPFHRLGLQRADALRRLVQGALHRLVGGLLQLPIAVRHALAELGEHLAHHLLLLNRPRALL